MISRPDHRAILADVSLFPRGGGLLAAQNRLDVAAIEGAVFGMGQVRVSELQQFLARVPGNLAIPLIDAKELAVQRTPRSCRRRPARMPRGIAIRWTAGLRCRGATPRSWICARPRSARRPRGARVRFHSGRGRNGPRGGARARRPLRRPPRSARCARAAINCDRDRSGASTSSASILATRRHDVSGTGCTAANTGTPR